MCAVPGAALFNLTGAGLWSTGRLRNLLLVDVRGSRARRGQAGLKVVKSLKRTDRSDAAEDTCGGRTYPTKAEVDHTEPGGLGRSAGTLPRSLFGLFMGLM